MAKIEMFVVLNSKVIRERDDYFHIQRKLGGQASGFQILKSTVFTFF